MPKINYTCSLGKICQSSQVLKRNMYKSCSYPFDWIFSNSKMIIDCLEDNFNTFLDKSYYINISELQCGHSKYNSLNMFNHHNPLINEDHYNYFIRCVDRFRILLKKPEHKLFLMTFVNLDSVNENTKNEVIDFNNKFSKYTSNYKLLVIFHIRNKKKNLHTFTYNDNIHFLELNTLSESSGSNFKNKNDNIYLDNVIKSNYDFSILAL
jgi:hypothetical protein